MAAPQKNQAQLPAPKTDEKPKQLSIVEKVEQELQSLTSANFYQIPARGGGFRMEPDSRALQHYANKSGGIATKVLDSGMDMDHAWAHVQAWPKKDTTMVMEDKVTIVYELEFQSYVWDYVGKGCPRHKGGCPIVKDVNGKPLLVGGMPQLEDGIDVLELRRLLNRKMRFAEREAITKAKSRLYKLIMNMEWRDVEEIENEAQDVKTINDNAPLPALNAPKAAAAPATTAPAAAQTTKTEAPKPTPAKQAPKAAEKAKEAPKQAPAAPAAAPKPAEKAPEAAVTKPPQAVIPPDPFAKKEEPAPKVDKDHPTGNFAEPPVPKKRSERIADLTGVLSCSSGNILVFAAGQLGIDQNGLNQRKEDLDCVLYALEHCAKEYNPSTVGSFVKQEPMSAEFKKKISESYLIFFATEKNRLAEVK
jgi:chemotaxis protein histidine kinase CheA